MADAADCSCGAPLAGDQRYCLRCGAATPRGESLRTAAFGPSGSGASAAAPPSMPVNSASTGARRVRLLGTGVELPISAATAVFALVLGTSAWAGARAAAPGAPAPVYAYAAPAPAPAAAGPVPAGPAAGAAATDAPLASSGGGSAVADTGVTSDPLASLTSATPDDSAATDDGTAPDPAPAAGDDAGSGDDTQDPGGDDDDTPQAATPTLDRVVVVALPALPYDAIGDPAGPAPYLAGTLAAKGVFLRAFSATSQSVLASRVALLTGQEPNPSTLAGCPAPAPVLPGTIGADDQAQGDGCLYSPDVFAVGDLLGSSDRTWRAYAEAPPSDCAPLAPGVGWPADRPVPLLLGALTGAPDCTAHLAPWTQLAGDLAGKDAPALAYVQVDRPDPASTDAALRELVPQLQAALKGNENSAILLLPSASLADADGIADSSACCARPWVADQSAGGGGRTGAVVLSPLAKAGTVLDDPLDQYDALKTVSEALGVRPLGYAGRDEVTGLPRSAWARWKGAPSVDPTQTAG